VLFVVLTSPPPAMVAVLVTEGSALGLKCTGFIGERLV
jgi:hypothetical protein